MNLCKELIKKGISLVCYDKDLDPTIKTETARDFLNDHGYTYVDWEDFDVDDFSPHVVFLQTQYDTNRERIYHRNVLMNKGYRVVMISYGIEIGYTAHARNDQFRNPVADSWRVYTLSEQMRRCYLPYTKEPKKIVATGLPRFDLLYEQRDSLRNRRVLEKANGRKIVLWKVHFPKIIQENGKLIQVTPDIHAYIDFANRVDEYKDLYFIFMPHPRFNEFNEDPEIRAQTRQLFAILRRKENVFVDIDDDYRPSLMTANAIIIDRSAVMVEAAVVDVPVLFMSNADYYEPMTPAIAPLVDSYEQGLTCGDMTGFIERVRQGVDLKKQEREAAFRLCVPGFDGNCSKRIVEDIVSSLERESSALSIEERLDRIEAMLAELQRGESR